MKAFQIVAALVLPILLGWLLVGLAWPASFRTKSLTVARICLSLGFGAGLCSLTWFLSVFFFGASVSALLSIEIALAIALGVRFAVVRKRDSEVQSIADPSYSFLTNKWTIAVLFGCVLADCVLFANLTSISPTGDWDSLMIFNMRARFFFTSGQAWQTGFSPIIGWSHPDYPLLIPGFIARIWHYLESDPYWVSQMVAALYTVLTPILLCSTLCALDRVKHAVIATVILLSTPFYITMGAVQAADVPLGFFMLSTCACLFLAEQAKESGSGFLVLAGLSAGLAAWTKNEGLLFAVAVSIFWIASLFFSKDRLQGVRRSCSFLSAVLPVAIVIAMFKNMVPAYDVFAGQTKDSILAHFTEPTRYLDVVEYFLYNIWIFGHWIISPIPFIVIYWYWLHKKEKKPGYSTLAPLFLALGAVLLGYAAIYLLVPGPESVMVARIVYSLGRLYLDLFPFVLLLIFVQAPVAEPSSGSATK